jgi:hypothetical protein
MTKQQRKASELYKRALLEIVNTLDGPLKLTRGRVTMIKLPLDERGYNQGCIKHLEHIADDIEAAMEWHRAFATSPSVIIAPPDEIGSLIQNFENEIYFLRRLAGPLDNAARTSGWRQLQSVEQAAGAGMMLAAQLNSLADLLLKMTEPSTRTVALVA